MTDQPIAGELRLRYPRYSSLHLLRQTGLVAGTRITGGLLIVMALFTIGSREALALAEFAVAVILLALPDLIAFGSWLRWRRRSDGTVRYVVSPAGIFAWDGVTENRFAWSRFSDVQIKRDAWVFDVCGGDLWVVPRSAFAREDLPLAEAVIQQRITPPTSRRR